MRQNLAGKEVGCGQILEIIGLTLEAEVVSDVKESIV